MNAAPKENLALRTEERWRPPTFKPVVGWRARFGAAVRRFFDLQAGSLWRDLGPVLTRARGTLVDVGCGAQPYRGLLRGDAVYVGLDTERAREDFGYAMPDVLLIGEDGRWPLDDSRADFVLATETLEHVIEPRAFLAEAHRCLTPGGRLILTVPFAARWHYIPHDYWRFTPSSLRLLLEQSGSRTSWFRAGATSKRSPATSCWRSCCRSSSPSRTRARCVSDHSGCSSPRSS